MSHADVREQVLDEVLPSDTEAEESRDLFSRIQAFVDDEFDRDAELMGSTAKETFMAGDKDLDIFVFFPEHVGEEELEEEGLDIGEGVFEEFDGDYQVEYAEHPYTKGNIEGYEVEIVPAYRVESGEDIKSSVDRTPFHRDWVNDHLSETEKEEVVLLKAFLRGQDLYGSTLRIEGFSGYLCELLIAEYGSVDELLAAAVEWAGEEVIDPADHHDQLPARLRDRFEDENLVVIDPVDPDRNVAAVLSRENYARFVYSAWRYRQQPSTEFFFPEQSTPGQEELAEAAEERGDFIVLEFPAPDLLEDILYPQLRRLQSRLDALLAEHEFRLRHSGFHVDEDHVRILFELFSAELPRTQVHEGPKVFHNEEHVANFSEAYDQVWVEDTRLTTIVDREFTSAEQLLVDFLDRDLAAAGVPDNLVNAVAQAEVVELEFESDDWRRFLRDEFHLGVGR
ncbi:MAG: CCA tRNA nucleotidyltransferase [Candidatus Nanohaloarchaea archaeon]|nr:CCA tRNA nucleotidyltransferase [Candidatus Nanohaloarchaea archaeon]